MSTPTLAYTKLPSHAEVITRADDAGVTYAVPQSFFVLKMVLVGLVGVALCYAAALGIGRTIQTIDQPVYLARPLLTTCCALIFAAGTFFIGREIWNRRRLERGLRFTGDKVIIFSPETASECDEIELRFIDQFGSIRRGRDVLLRPIGDLEVFLIDGDTRIALRTIHVDELDWLVRELNRSLSESHQP